MLLFYLFRFNGKRVCDIGNVGCDEDFTSNSTIALLTTHGRLWIMNFYIVTANTAIYFRTAVLSHASTMLASCMIPDIVLNVKQGNCESGTI